MGKRARKSKETDGRDGKDGKGKGKAFMGKGGKGIHLAIGQHHAPYHIGSGKHGKRKSGKGGNDQHGKCKGGKDGKDPGTPVSVRWPTPLEEFQRHGWRDHDYVDPDLMQDYRSDSDSSSSSVDSEEIRCFDCDADDAEPPECRMWAQASIVRHGHRPTARRDLRLYCAHCGSQTMYRL